MINARWSSLYRLWGTSCWRDKTSGEIDLIWVKACHSKFTWPISIPGYDDLPGVSFITVSTTRFVKHELEQELLVLLETIDLSLEGGPTFPTEIHLEILAISWMEYGIWNRMELTWPLGISPRPTLLMCCRVVCSGTACTSCPSAIRASPWETHFGSTSPWVSLGQWWAWQLDATGWFIMVYRCL